MEGLPPDRNGRQLKSSLARFETMWQNVESDASNALKSMVNLAKRLEAIETTNSSLLEKYKEQITRTKLIMIAQFEKMSLEVFGSLPKFLVLHKQMAKLVEPGHPVLASDESEMQFEACLVNVKQAIRCYGVEYWKKVELLDNYDANRQPDVVETLYNKWKALSLPYHK